MTTAHALSTPMVSNVHAGLRNKWTDRNLDMDRFLIYLEQVNKLDFSYQTDLMGQHMAKSNIFHRELAKKVLNYLVGTTGYSLVYHKPVKLQLIAHCDAVFPNSEKRYIQSGYINYLSHINLTISWNSCRQRLVARSSTEVEYISIPDTACELLWFQPMFRSLQFRSY